METSHEAERPAGKKVGIINAGAWGTALGKILAEKNHSVEMWDFMPEVVEDINTRHQNSRYLLGVNLPGNLTATSDLAQAAGGKDFLIIASPSLYVISAVKQLIRVPEILEGQTVIGVVSKGFIDSPRGPALIIRSIEDYLPGSYKNNLVYISGPSHAEEVARGKLTGLISASPNGKNAIRFRELLSSSSLMVFPSLDIVGVQTCGAVKNVIALSFGMLEALMELDSFFGDNTESLLLAAGLNEIQLIGSALGSVYPETFTSIAGVGDLDVTCRSRYSRNRRFGVEIIKGRAAARFQSIDDLIENISRIGYLPEGAIAAKYVKQIADRHKLKLPICETVYRVLNRDVEPMEALRQMLKDLTGA